jgi:hypothetical protein
MKKIILFAFFFAFAASASAQNYTNKQMALIDYDLKVSKEFREDIQSLQDHIGSAEVHNKDADDRLKALLIHHLYYNMAPRLERELDMSILPINSFMQEVRYDKFGYPRASINRALRKGDSPFYFKLEIALDSKTEEKREEKPELPDNITFPRFTIDVIIYNDEGMLPVDKWHGEAEPEEGMVVEKAMLGEFIDQPASTSGPPKQTLSTLFEDALDKLINTHLND